ncbi:hypothetical protein [Nocardia niwae]|uniref:hypothetical protein n=1 Tax=Nocardia niwae TaxID=626084 RepID=UPI0007A4AA4C|nr:hypothetical protein [Nocardia niwae]
MADEANPQEITIENSTTDTTADIPVDTVDTPDIGADVQGTETDTTETEPEKTDSAPDPEVARLKKELEKARREAAANRVKGNEKAEQAAKDAADAAQKALTEQIARTLGLIKDDTPPDPADLLAQAQERERQIAQERDTAAERLRAYERKDALTAAASKVDGDLASLLDSRSVNAAIEKLDTTADDFAAQVEAIVSAAVENNPKLKKAPAQAAAPRSGGDMSGGNASPNSTGEKDIDSFRRDVRAHRGFAD